MADKTSYTPETYQSSYVDFYNMGGIDVTKAPDPDPDPDPDPVVRPNVLDPVGGDDRSNIFTGVSLSTGKPAFKVGSVDYNEYIQNFDANLDNQAKKGEDKSLGGFGKWAAEQLKKPEMAIGTPVGAAMGNPALGGLMIAAGAMNRKKQYENATKIAATGGTGGSMFMINNQTISRAPGSRIYSGTLGDMSQEQVAAVEAINRGLIPGTMVETASGREDESGNYNVTGKSGLVSIDGAIMDAYGNIHSAGGRASASQATALREKLYVDAMNLAEYSLEGVNVSRAALEMKQALDASAKGGIGFFETVRRQDTGTYNSNLSGSQQFIENYLAERHEEKKAAPTTSGGPAPDPRQGGGEGGAPQSSGGSDSGDGGGTAGSGLSQAQQTAGDRYQAMADRGYSGAVSSGNQDENESRSSGSSSGGSYGAKDSTGGSRRFAQGGVADAPAGFVERPPSQVSEAATVADDKPMSVPEGTFVINAAAVEFAGEGDIAKMLNDAYAKAGKQGSAAPSKEQVDVAVSRGEVIVPPAIAKIIGYDRLEKINNRGKKETSKRIEENGQRPAGAAGGGFLTRKKFANGGEADLEYEDRIITDEVRRKMAELLKTLPEDTRVTSKHFGDERAARREYYEELARLNETRPLTGEFFSAKAKKVINVPQTPTLFNLYIMAEEVAHQLGNTKKPYPVGIFKVSDKQVREYQESKYAEELRAKKIAFDAVGGLFPKDKRTADMYESNYGNKFASYVLSTGSPEFFQEMVTKYPKLKSQINADGTLKNKHASPNQDFLLAVQEEEARIRDEFDSNTFFQRMNPLTDTPKYHSGYSGPEGNPYE